MFLLMASDIKIPLQGGPNYLPASLIGQQLSLEHPQLEQANMYSPLTFWEIKLEVCHVFTLSNSLSPTDFKLYQ